MGIYGYARVSTTDQDLDVQTEALRRAGCELVRGERVSGNSMRGRKELETLLQFLRPGDTLMVTRIDRLARSMVDLQTIVTDLRSRNITLKMTEQPVDTSTLAGKAFLDMLGVFAEFETGLRRERQAEGIAKAKARGVYRGRKPHINPAMIRELKAQGMGAAAIARATGFAKSSIYKALGTPCSI
jgi:DNA invertase Pin-like site-specific DNA recombinase